MSQHYYTYIMISHSRVIYTGVTNDLCRRVQQHKTQAHEGFTSKYNVNMLVYYETTSDVKTAIEREKHTKGWIRAKKIALIETQNPAWVDLSIELCDEGK